MKLGPGFDRELIPADAEAQWVSVDGERRRDRASGSGRSPARASAAPRSCVGAHGSRRAHRADADSDDAEVRRARRVPLRARRRGHPRPADRRPGPQPRRADAQPRHRLPHRRRGGRRRRSRRRSACVETFPLDEKTLKRELRDARHRHARDQEARRRRRPRRVPQAAARCRARHSADPGAHPGQAGRHARCSPSGSERSSRPSRRLGSPEAGVRTARSRHRQVRRPRRACSQDDPDRDDAARRDARSRR